MKGIGRAAAAAGIAVSLFLVGSLGLGRVLRTEPQPVTPGAAGALASEVSNGTPITSAGTLAELVVRLQDRLRAVPDDWRSFASLGLAYVQQARITADPSYYPKADRALARSLELRPDGNVEALLGMGALDLARHDFEGALEHGRAALALNPSSGAVRGVIGDALLELGRYDQAFAAFQEMVDRRPDLASYARASYALELQGDVRGAIQAMDLARGSAGGAAEDAAWVAYQLGELAFGQGDLEAAEREYARGLARAPDFTPNRAGLAQVAAARGDLDRAIRLYERVVARYPSIQHVAALGDLYQATGQDDLAERRYRLVEAQERLAAANGVNTDLELALFHADHPERPGLGSALERAMAEYRRRASVHVADAVAWALHANGRDAEALGYARKALALGYRSASFHFHAGMIAAGLGRDGVARRWLSEALEINPYFSVRWSPVARRTLARLGGGA